MQKGAEAFRSIGEVAKLIGVAPHVLRYWETQFPLLRPMKRPDGRRYYRPEDVRLAAGLCDLLRDEGLTIRGARKLLARDRGESVRARGEARLAAAGSSLSPAEEAPMSPSGSRTRQRRRRTSSDDGALPLFRDLNPLSAQGIWLARLTGLARQLEALHPRGPRWQAARGTARRLEQAMTQLS